MSVTFFSNLHFETKASSGLVEHTAAVINIARTGHAKHKPIIYDKFPDTLTKKYPVFLDQHYKDDQIVQALSLKTPFY